jgi:hypothetical protein
MRGGEMADAPDLKSGGGNSVWVQVPSAQIPAPVAQWSEQVAHNDLVGGSNPSGGTT